MVYAGIKIEIVANNFRINKNLSNNQIIKIKDYLINEGFTDNMPDWCIYCWEE